MSTHPFDHAAVVSPGGDATHILVPREEYERLARSGPRAIPTKPSSAAIEEAMLVLGSTATEWTDANEVMRDVIGRGLASVRKGCGLSQKELGELLGASQSQVSRYEKKPDSVTIGVLRRIAQALQGHTGRPEKG